MGRPQQRARKKQSGQVKISSICDCCPVGQITYPKSIQEFLNSTTNPFGKLHCAFQENFVMFLKKYKDESQTTIKLKHEQRLNFAFQCNASAVLDDKEIGPKLDEIGLDFSGQTDPNFKRVDDMLEGFDGAQTLVSYLKDLFNKDQTVRDYLINAIKRGRVKFNSIVQEALIGSIVTTRYNNRSYRIDDIDFDSTPRSTFTVSRGKERKEVSFVYYFKRKHDIDIQDHKQPLLLNVSNEQDKQGVTRIVCLIPELSFTAEAMEAELRVKNDPNSVVLKELVVSAYRWVIEQLDLDLAEFKVFREGLNQKEREKWHELVVLYNDKFLDKLANDEELVNIQKEIELANPKEIEDIIARYKNRNKDIDTLVHNIEGKSLGAFPKKKSKEKSCKSNKKNKKRENTDASNKSLVQGEIKIQESDEKLVGSSETEKFKQDLSSIPIEEPHQESGYKGNKNRKNLDTKSKDVKNNNSLMQESIIIKELAELELADSIKTEQLKPTLDSTNIVDLKEKETLKVDETRNGLGEGQLNSQLNFDLPSSCQMNDQRGEEQMKNSQVNIKLKFREPLGQMSVSDPNEVREEVRDRYIKDIVEVSEKIEYMRRELMKNDEIREKELKDLKTKHDQENLTLDDESGREMGKLKQEMWSIKKRMAETEAKWEGKKQQISARHSEENKVVKEKYTDKEMQNTLANLIKTSAQLTDDMKKLDIDPNVAKQVDNAREMLECPICMEMMTPPTRIWMCSGSHCVCEKCKSLLTGNLCPTCRSNKVNMRALIAENLARALFKQ